jgi:hypothetical protein
MSLANLSRKLTDAASKTAMPDNAATIPDGISLSVVSLSERIVKLEEAVKQIQNQLAGPTSTKGALDFEDILPSGGGKWRQQRQRQRRTRKNRSRK